MFRQMVRGMFASIDLFGVPVVINYSGKEKLKTRFGAVCSVLFFFLVVWALYNASNEMFQKLNPKSVDYQTHTEDPKKMTLTPDNFPIAIGVQAPQELLYTAFVNDQIFTIEATLNSIVATKNADGSSNRTLISKNVIMDKCKTENFGEDASVFANMDLNTLFCLSMNQSDISEVSIQGAYLSSIYQTLTINMYQCNSTTSTCASEDDIKKYLEGVWFNVVFANMVIDPSKYSNPDSRYQDFYTKAVTRTTRQDHSIYLSHLHISTDSGWLFEEINQLDYVTLDKVAENSYSKEKDDASVPLIAVTFQVSKLELNYTRSYKKLQAVLAEVAGLSNTILLVILVVTAPYRKLRFRETLMNQLYDVSTNPNGNEKKIQQAKQWVETGPDAYNINTEQNSPVNVKTRVPSSTGLKRKDSPSREPLFKIQTRGSGDNGSEEIKQSSPKYLKSLDALKEYNPRKNSTNERPYRRISHSRAHSWREQQEQQEQGVLKSMNKSTVDHHQFSLASLKNERLDGDKIKPHEFFARQDTVKLQRKIVDDLDNDNPDNSLLFGHIESHRSQKAEEGQKNEEGPLSTTRNNNQDVKEDYVVKIDAEKMEPNTNKKLSPDKKDKKGKRSKSRKGKSEKQINLTVWEYLLAFIYQPKSLEQKIQIIEDGSRNIDQRLDVVNILKKMRDIDKMRALLFDADQLLLFNNLPKPVVKSKLTEKLQRKKTVSHEMLKRTSLIDNLGSPDDVYEAYERLKDKEHKTLVDKKLLDIFSETLN